MMLKHLDLFSGIGGFALGLQRTGGFETVAFCEIEPYCQKVLAKNFPNVPIEEDVRTIDAAKYRPDIITGGYPCQPFSTAGKRRGADDDRHLWPAMFDTIKATRPSWVIGENVAGHVSMGLDGVLSDLESEGYTCQAFVIPAVAVDAKHRRDRTWVVGHNQRPSPTNDEAQVLQTVDNADGAQREGGRLSSGVCSGNTNFSGRSISRNASSVVANPISVGQSRQGEPHNASDQAPNREGKANKPLHDGVGAQWSVEPKVGRVADGIPYRMDRLKGLGNAVVPQIPEMIGRAILSVEVA